MLDSYGVYGQCGTETTIAGRGEGGGISRISRVEDYIVKGICCVMCRFTSFIGQITGTQQDGLGIKTAVEGGHTSQLSLIHI